MLIRILLEYQLKKYLLVAYGSLRSFSAPVVAHRNRNGQVYILVQTTNHRSVIKTEQKTFIMIGLIVLRKHDIAQCLAIALITIILSSA